MKLTDATSLPPKTGNPRWDWPTMAKTLNRVWSLTAGDDYEPGEAKAVTESARAWAKRRGLTVSVVTLDLGAEVQLIFQLEL